MVMTKDQRGNESKEPDSPTTHSDGTDKDESQESPEEEEDSPEVPESTTSVNRWKLYVGIGFICCFFAVASSWLSSIQGIISSSEADHSRHFDVRIKDYVKLWRNSYPNQNTETWTTIVGQLSDFASVGNMSPLVIVMAYDEAHKTTQILASELSRAALQLINDPDKCGDTDVAKIYGSNSKIKGGYLLSNYLPQIEKCRKMVLMNLEKLDGNTAIYLHSMIDPDHPNIPNVVYIFTVKIPKTEENVYRAVRKVLTSNWSEGMGDNSFNALLSRLVNNVKIIPEPDFES